MVGMSTFFQFGPVLMVKEWEEQHDWSGQAAQAPSSYISTHVTFSSNFTPNVVFCLVLPEDKLLKMNSLVKCIWKMHII